jgi:hypothetical protein
MSRSLEKDLDSMLSKCLGRVSGVRWEDAMPQSLDCMSRCLGEREVTMGRRVALCLEGICLSGQESRARRHKDSS